MSQGQLYCNAYIEGPDRRVLAVYNPKGGFWSLPGCLVRADETSGSAAGRTPDDEPARDLPSAT
jgi:ADP-ribose pyrophosphatase YjhB (NUDIX family)